MSCSMMSRFKAGIFLILTILMILIPLKEAAGEIKEEKTADKSTEEIPKAEILLVYQQNPSKQEITNIQIIVKILTYLQHSVVYLPIEKAETVVDQYVAIICYNIESSSEGFIPKLISKKHKIFMIGSGGVQRFILAKRFPVITTKTPAEVAGVSYEFTEKKEFSALVNLQDGLFLQGGLTYTRGTIATEVTAGLYSGYEDFIYLPITDLTEALIEASFTREVAKWLWPYQGEPHTYSQYIVLNEVYPFIPPEKLLEVVEYFIKLKIPFVISVMPIYENGDYPSMQRFCDILRYAQANGGSIIMHAPILQQEEDKVEQVWKYLTIATEAYTNKGVYPLGIEAPERFMFTQAGREILKRYSTVFFYQDKDFEILPLKESFNTVYQDGHAIIAPAICLDQQGESKFTEHSTACYLDMADSIDQIKKKIKGFQLLAPPMKDLWEMEHIVYADNLYFYTKNRQAYLNKEKLSLEYIPFTEDKNFDYKNGVFQWIFTDLKELNNKLVLIVLISTLGFLTLMLRTRRLNRRKFLLDKRRET